MRVFYRKVLSRARWLTSAEKQALRRWNHTLDTFKQALQLICTGFFWHISLSSNASFVGSRGISRLKMATSMHQSWYGCKEVLDLVECLVIINTIMDRLFTRGFDCAQACLLKWAPSKFEVNSSSPRVCCVLCFLNCFCRFECGSQSLRVDSGLWYTKPEPYLRLLILQCSNAVY